MTQTSVSNGVHEAQVLKLIENPPVNAVELRSILEAVEGGQRLSLRDAAALLNVQEPELMAEIFHAARTLKEQVFGKRIVLFAPLYISNRCANNCLYCGFRHDNSDAERKTLSIAQIIREAAYLYSRGYRRVLLVAGEEFKSSSIDYLIEAVRAIYDETKIRIVHVNAAPMTVEAFSRLKASGAGVYQCFQETYHRETYSRMHPSGPKRDFEWRFSVMHRAMEGGFDDVGMGALFGLYDHRFEVISLIAHARALEEESGVGPHTVSVPRMQPAGGAVLTDVPYPVSDETFKMIVAVLRLALPNAGVVVSTRESAPLRGQVIRLGASQISAGSRTDIGGYTRDKGRTSGTAQFALSDQRSLDEIIRAIMDAGLIPSLCTACYRSGRTGRAFRSAVERGELEEFCHTNALLSLFEYMKDHAPEATRQELRRYFQKALASVKDENRRRKLERMFERIDGGEADVHL
jgi:2-iminoacetate synthase